MRLHVLHKTTLLRALAMLKVIKLGTLGDKYKFQRFIVSFLRLRYRFKEGYRPFIGLD